ncbi:MAG: hypothetical protein ACR2JB_13180 [Bryobacteraceae bacterium]
MTNLFSGENSFNVWINDSCVSFPVLRQIVNGNKALHLEREFRRDTRHSPTLWV